MVVVGGGGVLVLVGGGCEGVPRSRSPRSRLVAGSPVVDDGVSVCDPNPPVSVDSGVVVCGIPSVEVGGAVSIAIGFPN